MQGEGEENEELIGNELRAKLYLLISTPATEDQPEKTEWKDFGIAIFKVKRNTETGKIRLLGRNEANSRVVMVRFEIRKGAKETCVADSILLELPPFQGSCQYTQNREEGS